MAPKKAARKAPAKKSAAKKAPTKRSPAARVRKVVHQVREPFSLLQTLKDEGVANALTLFTMANAMASSVASGAARNLRPDAIRPQLKELVGSLGFALREDLERLESRIEELEQSLSEREYEKLKSEDE